MRETGVGVIGLGQMGCAFARILSSMPSARIVGVADIMEGRARALASELGVTSYTDYRALLSEPALDAVVITTPDQLHLEPALAAAEAGKHVFIEKPLATRAEDAEQIISAVEGRELVLFVAHVLRFDPAYAAAREAVRSGQVGDVVHVFGRRNATPTEARRLHGRTSVTFYLAVHDIDAMHWVLGSQVTGVYSRSVRGSIAAELGVDDSILSMLEFENGAMGILETTWLRPEGPTLSTAGQLEVMGTRGMVEALPFISCANVYTSRTAAPSNQAYLLAPGPHGFIGGIYRDEVVHFLDCVTTGRAPLCTGREALAAVAVAEAIDRSVATRQEVPIKLAMR